MDIVKHLVLELRPTPRVLLSDDVAADLPRLFGALAELSTENQILFLGFYDWLRTSEGRVVGIRLCLHDGQEHVGDAIRASGAGAWEGPYIWELLFVSDVVVDYSISGDQDFLESRCYHTSEGMVVLTFEDPPALDRSVAAPAS